MVIFVSHEITYNYCDLVSILNFELVVCNACLKQYGQAAPSQKLLLFKAVFEAVSQYIAIGKFRRSVVCGASN